MVVRLKKRNRAKEIVKWLTSEKRERLMTGKLLAARPYDLALAALSLSSDTYARMIRLLEPHPHKLARLHADMPAIQAAKRLATLDSALAARIVENMEPDDATDILRNMVESSRKACLQQLSDTARTLLAKSLRHDPQTAAGNMNPRLMLLKPEMTVGEVLTLLKSRIESIELFETLFVVDENRVVCGFVVIEDLLRRAKTSKIKTVMQADYFSVAMLDPIEDVVDAMRKYDILAMPVLNETKQIVGIITLYDVLDIIQKESYDDTLGFVGLRAAQNKPSWRKSWLYRLRTLCVPALIFSLSGALLGGLWHLLELTSPSWILLPFLLTTTSVAVSQSLATSIADLHLDKERMRHVFNDTWLGAGMALIIAGLTFMLMYSLNLNNPQSSLNSTLQAIFMALVAFLGILFASFIASIIPAALKALKREPNSINVIWVQAASQLLVVILFSIVVAFISS